MAPVGRRTFLLATGAFLAASPARAQQPAIPVVGGRPVVRLLPVGVTSLESVFNPRAVAVVGASDRPGKMGTLFMRNLAGFPGDVIPVTTSQDRVDGRPAYASLRDVPAERSWLGPIDRSKSGLPFFGQLGQNHAILVGAGYSGNGVGPSFLGGTILASLARGIDDEWAHCALVRQPAGLPPEPVRYLGGRIVRSAVARKERAEDAMRKPRRVDTLLVSLAPAALVPLKQAEQRTAP